MKKNLVLFFLLLTICFAFFVRSYNADWDDGSHIHPDERFLTMVETGLKIPATFNDYMDSRVSTMNPHNTGSGFYVYGTFPIYLVKLLAIPFQMDDYGKITILGRYVSAIFDTGVVILLYLISGLIFKSKNGSKQKKFGILLPSLLYSIMVLPIQLSHFFATDTFLTFFMILSFYLGILTSEKILQKKWNQVLINSIFLGVSIGLGLASKITMIFIIPLDALLIIIAIFQNGLSLRKLLSSFCLVLIYSFIPAIIITYLSFRLTMPMAFSDGNVLNFTLNTKWIKNLTDLQNMNSPSLGNTFPPAIQWFTTKPILYPASNLILWGMGIPLATICIFGLILNFKFLIFDQYLKIKLFNFRMKVLNLLSPLSLLEMYSIAFFIYQGIQFSKNMRYIYPIYWCLAILGGVFLLQLFRILKRFPTVLGIIIISLIIYPLAFFQIYTKPHSRVSASRWIFQNVKIGSHITFEEWDDPLPLLVDNHPLNVTGSGLPMFWPDSNPDKWSNIFNQISQADYVFITSNRVYGSVPRRPDIFFLTIKYYQLLFAGKLGLRQVAEFHSRPTIPFLNFEFIDDKADESFTVYDHPVVTIFKNAERLSEQELMKRLNP
jgi:hypothetical protein